MPNYTITRVSSAVRDVTLDHGDFKSYRFNCDGHGDTVFTLLQKPETAPPAVGDTFEATVKSTFDDGTVNLKKVPQQRGGPGGGGKGPRTENEEKWITARFAVEEATKLATTGYLDVEKVEEKARSLFALVVEMAP